MVAPCIMEQSQSSSSAVDDTTPSKKRKYPDKRKPALKRKFKYGEKQGVFNLNDTVTEAPTKDSADEGLAGSPETLLQTTELVFQPPSDHPLLTPNSTDSMSPPSIQKELSGEGTDLSERIAALFRAQLYDKGRTLDPDVASVLLEIARDAADRWTLSNSQTLCGLSRMSLAKLHALELFYTRCISTLSELVTSCEKLLLYPKEWSSAWSRFRKATLAVHHSKGYVNSFVRSTLPFGWFWPQWTCIPYNGWYDSTCSELISIHTRVQQEVARLPILNFESGITQLKPFVVRLKSLIEELKSPRFSIITEMQEKRFLRALEHCHEQPSKSPFFGEKDALGAWNEAVKSYLKTLIYQGLYYEADHYLDRCYKQVYVLQHAFPERAIEWDRMLAGLDHYRVLTQAELVDQTQNHEEPPSSTMPDTPPPWPGDENLFTLTDTCEHNVPWLDACLDSTNSVEPLAGTPASFTEHQQPTAHDLFEHVPLLKGAFSVNGFWTHQLSRAAEIVLKGWSWIGQVFESATYANVAHLICVVDEF